MLYRSTYRSPLGEISLAADNVGLTGLWFVGQKYCECGMDEGQEREELPVFIQARGWLDCYFSGRRLAPALPLHLMGTPFQMEVWELLRKIPYGAVTTYGALAEELAARRGLARMSARAVGSAVGRNPISIMVPCHRVVGADGRLIGYAGGLERKRRLLALEWEGRATFTV